MKLPKFLYKRLKTHNTSLGDNGAFPPEDEFSFDYKIIKTRYNDVMEMVENSQYKDFTEEDFMTELSKLIAKCKELEEPIKNNLIKVCENTVFNLFDVPMNAIELQCDIVDKIQPNHPFRVMPESSDSSDYDFEDLNDFDNMSVAVLKRRFINSLIQGAAYTYSSTKYYLSEVYQLNNELPNLYDKIRLINDYLLFNVEEKITDKNPMQGACVEVELGREGEKTIIQAQGLIFPYLLTEVVRGFFELFSSHGLPQDNKKAAYIIKQSDFLLAEPWDLRFGVKLWGKIGGDIHNTKILPYFFMDLCETDAETFNTSVKEILANTNHGKAIKNDFITTAEHDFKLNDMSVNMQKKNSEKSIIIDQYMTEEDIDNFNYGNVKQTEFRYYKLIKECTTDDIDFSEEQINDYQFQMHVFIKNEQIPIGIANFKAEPRYVNGQDLYQVHIFIDKNYQHMGFGYKLFKRFVELYGNVYSGNGRRMNNSEILSILNKLGKEPNMTLKKVENKLGDIVGYAVFLNQF